MRLSFFLLFFLVGCDAPRHEKVGNQAGSIFQDSLEKQAEANSRTILDVLNESEKAADQSRRQKDQGFPGHYNGREPMKYELPKKQLPPKAVPPKWDQTKQTYPPGMTPVR